MSRKSKRRRMRQMQTGSEDGRLDVAEGFEFLDDRQEDVPALATSPVAEEPETEAAQRIASVPALPTPRLVRGGEESEPPRGHASPPSDRRPAERRDAMPPAAPAAPPAAPPGPPVQTLGELLVSTREARGLTLDEASARTRIAAKMLAHLENDRFGEFAAEAYARGFLRNYASFLGLDPQLLLARFEALQGGRPQPVPEVWEATVEPVRPAPRRRPPKRGTVVLSIVVSAFAVLAAAAIYLARDARVPLRPAAGLQQIEEELRRAQPAPSGANTQAVPEPAAPEPGPMPQTTAADSGHAPVAANDLEPQPIEDTSPGVPGATETFPSRALAEPSKATDLLEEVAPPAPPGGRTATAPPVVPADDSPLTLTATALDSCILRVQVDGDTREGRRYEFTRRGETRSWNAEQTFRVVAQPASNLELRLNGRLVPVPADGRGIVLDRGTLQPERRSTTAPKRSAAASVRRPRRSTSSAAPAAPPAPTPAPAEPQHAAGPP